MFEKRLKSIETKDNLGAIGIGTPITERPSHRFRTLIY